MHGVFYYRCHRRCKAYSSIKEDVLENTVWNALRDAILNPQIIKDQIQILRDKTLSDGKTLKTEASEIQVSTKNLDLEEARLLKA